MKYCTQCGYGNPPKRGACLMCYYYLDVAPEGNICPNCETDNPRDAVYCRNCATVLDETAVTEAPAPALAEAATAIVDATGGALGVEEEEYAEEDYMEAEGAPEEDEEFQEFLAQQDQIRGGADETGAPPPPPAPDAAEEEEEEALPAPSELSFDDEEEFESVREEELPAPGAEEEEEEELAPPPPPSGLSLDQDVISETESEVEEEEEELLPPPAPPSEIEEAPEDEVSMPVPEDLPGLDEEGEQEPPAEEMSLEEQPPAGAEQPEAAPEAEEAEAEEEEEEGLGGWSLDFDEEDEQ
ncbi:MAG: double zinc ribbon domain-containing protein [Armatimonadota bacterium]